MFSPPHPSNHSPFLHHCCMSLWSVLNSISCSFYNKATQVLLEFSNCSHIADLVFDLFCLCQSFSLDAAPGLLNSFRWHCRLVHLSQELVACCIINNCNVKLFFLAEVILPSANPSSSFSAAVTFGFETVVTVQTVACTSSWFCSTITQFKLLVQYHDH